MKLSVLEESGNRRQETGGDGSEAEIDLVFPHWGCPRIEVLLKSEVLSGNGAKIPLAQLEITVHAPYCNLLSRNILCTTDIARSPPSNLSGRGDTGCGIMV